MRTDFIALDLGTTTGFACGATTGTIKAYVASGTYNLKGGRYEGGGMRYLRFRRFLTELVGPVDIDAKPRVFFEEVRRHMGTDAAHVYGGLMAVLTSFCEEHGIPYQGVPVGTIKKHATGTGNASKAEMMAAMQSKGFQPQDDNEADALAILHWAMEEGA